MDFQKPPDIPCPVCHQPTELLDVVDFNKTCAETQGVQLQLSGKPIYYNRCTACGFAFAPEMWGWSPEDFGRFVYNDDYAVVDPDYVELRPTRDAEFLEQLFPLAAQADHLDYGSGEGLLARLLNAKGWRTTAYDPFLHKKNRPARRFSFITAFEVFEHVPSVDDLMDDLQALAADEAIILFTTATSDQHVAPVGRLIWWYAAPRNGHISLYTTASLKLLAKRAGWAFASFSENLHCFCVGPVPAFARSVIKIEGAPPAAQP